MYEKVSFQSKDVLEIRELEQKFTDFVLKISSRLDALAEKTDNTSHDLASTMKIVVDKYEKSYNAMEKGLIDDESFARSYRIMQEAKGQGFGITNLQSIRKILDPNAEITMEVKRISEILKSGNQNFKEKEEARSGLSSPQGGLGGQGTNNDWKKPSGNSAHPSRGSPSSANPSSAKPPIPKPSTPS